MRLRIVFFVLFFLFSEYVYCNDVISKVSNLITQLKYEDAIVELEKQLETQPNNITYYFIIIDLSLRLGEIEVAEKYINRALRYDKNNVFINSYLMEIHRIKGNLKQASNIAQRILKVPESKTNLLFVVMYSRLLSEINVYDAEKFLSLYSKVYRDYRLFLEMARLYLIIGDDKKVKDFLDKAILLSRFDKDIYLLYGEYYFKRSNYVEAIKNLEKAVLFPGRKDREYYLLSSSYYHIGDYSKALVYLNKLDIRPEVVAKVMFLSGGYSDLIQRFSDSNSEVIRYFVEDSSIKLSPQDISSKRKELSYYRFRKALDLKKSGIPYYELYLRRALRLDPLNYDAWFEIANYYRYYNSPYFAFDELKVAKNLFLNNSRLQDLFSSLGDYVSNVSKLSSWDIQIENRRRLKILFEVEKGNIGLESAFFEDILNWALSAIKLVNASLEITGKKDGFYRKNYDFVFVLKPISVKDFFVVDLSLINPMNSSVLTNTIISVKFSDNVVSDLYYAFKTKMFSLIPYVGVVEGVRGNRFVVRFLGNTHKNGEEVIILDRINKGEEIARGRIIDTEGEYSLVELSDKDKYLKSVKIGQIVIRI